MTVSGASHEPIDILRKTVIVLLLVGAMLLLHTVAVPGEGFDPRGLLALGFVILATYTIGELAEAVGLPHITGYLLAGLALGSSAAQYLGSALPFALPPPLDEGILSEDIVDQLSLFNNLALALIALTAGGELKLDGLRRGYRQILGILGGQALFVPITAVVTLVGIAQFLPDAVPAIAALPLPAVASLGVIVAALAFATSPAATIAVINSTGSKGPMARTVLSTVVLKDVLVVTAYSAATALAVSVLGTGAEVGLLQSLGEIGASIAVGVALGGFIHLYLRFIGAELLLYLIATIYTATFIMEEIGGEPALMFIVAGILIGNFSDRGETLIHEVERLSLPVYVVFFTLAGANLHLDLVFAMAIPALILVFVRMGAMYAGTTMGSALTAAPRPVLRYGWLGFVSQAGVVIALATKLRITLPGEVGNTLFSLILAGVAINEVIGPVMLQAGLGFAGEVGGSKKGDNVPDDALVHGGAHPDDAPATWKATEIDRSSVWGSPLPTGLAELDAVVAELDRDLRALARDQTWLPLSDLRRDSEAWLRQLRREFLRVVRRASVRPGTAAQVAHGLRNDVGELGEHWRDLVLDLAARSTRSDRWSPLELVEAVDNHVATLPERFEAPVHPDELRRRKEPRFRAFRRWLLRIRQRISPPRREVPLRQLARYHFSGEVPARLEGLAALLINAELHLASRVNALFTLAVHRLEDAAAAAEEHGIDEVNARLAELRHDADAEFKLATEELTAIADDGAARAERALGTALQELRVDVRRVGTLDLPLRQRRYSRVFAARNEGLTLLGPGLQNARTVVFGRLQQLALELELVGLEGRVRDVVRSQSDQLVRLLRGRGPTQLRRVEVALREWLDQTRERLIEPPAARRLATELRTTSEPLAHQIAEAHEVVRSLSTQLTEEVWVNELLDALRNWMRGLTELYEVPTARAVTGEWALPKPVSTAELPFRDLVAGFFELRVTRDLLDLTVELGVRVQELVAALEEVERVVAFNVELAASELEVFDEDAPVGAEASELVHAMVIGAVGRTHDRLSEIANSADASVATAQGRVLDAVIGGMETLRSAILDGRIGELRGFWTRESPLGRGLARRARRWAMLPGTGKQLARLLRRTLGEDRLLALRSGLGLPEIGDERDLRSALAPPVPKVDVPLVYRRLFSEHALEAGDLLSGRQEQLDRLRQALAPSTGFRSASVVGLDLQACLALVNAATRAAQPVRWSPGATVSPQDVDEWFDELPKGGGRTVILHDLRWLFERRPNGFGALDRLVHGIVADRGRNAFVVVADRAVWDFAVRVSGLEEAMGTVLRLGGLSAEQLEQALMSRHAMSGYDVAFIADEDLAWQLQQALLRGEDRERNRRTAWFRTLHAASAGVLQDALRLWMASIEEVDRQRSRIRIGPAPRPPVTRLAQLPEQDLLTLVEVTRQGWIDVAQHMRLFRTSEGWSEAHLAQLRHVGLLVPVPAPHVAGATAVEQATVAKRHAESLDVPLRLAPHLRAPLHRAMARRGWS